MKATGRDKLQTIDKVLYTIFGKTASEALYHYLSRIYGLRKEEIPERLEDFALGLGAIFGSTALILEKLIVKHLQSRLRLTQEGEKPYGFVEFMKKIQEPM